MFDDKDVMLLQGKIDCAHTAAGNCVTAMYRRTYCISRLPLKAELWSHLVYFVTDYIMCLVSINKSL